MSEIKNETNASDKFEKYLTKYSDILLIVGKFTTVIILVVSLPVCGASYEFNWILFLGFLLSAIINLFLTYGMYYFLKVISNISMSLKK